MRKMFYAMAASMLLVLSFATVTMAQTANWDVTVNTPNGPIKFQASFQLNGETLSGTLKSERGELPLTGTLKGSDITLKYTVKFNDNDLPITMTGKVNGDSAKGDADFGGLAQGDWTATRGGGGAAAAAAPAAAAKASSAAAAGEWSLVFTTPNGDIPAKFSIKQEGENLMGEAKGEGPIGNVPLKGTLKGDVLEIKYTIKFEGNDMPITMKGKVTGAEMKGTADYGGLAEGEFKGKKN